MLPMDFPSALREDRHRHSGTQRRGNGHRLPDRDREGNALRVPLGRYRNLSEDPAYRASQGSEQGLGENFRASFSSRRRPDEVSRDMAKDYFTSRGLNTTQMMATALKYRNEFDMLHVELVDIVDIIEFRLIERFPEFRLVIVRDTQMKEDAFAEPLKNRITVRQSVYVAACDGDSNAR